MALTRKLARGDSSGSAPISIADKATAYALTGVVVGTVYKTDDTGQVMEYLGDVLPRYGGFTIAGSTATGDGDSFNGVYVFDASIGAHLHSTEDQGFDLLGSSGNASYNYGQGQYFNGSDASNTHPADQTTWAVQIGGGGALLKSEFTKADPESNPLNWKINGVVSVYNNDEKQLLTNLPDTQQVEVVGEGGRIERFNGSPLPDIKRGFIVSSEGNPRSSVSDGGSSVSGAFFWHEGDSQFVRDDDGGYYNAYFVHDGSRWQIGYQMGYYFQSDLCASTVHPADATGWTAYDQGGGIGQGTIADDGLVKTTACEVYNSPQSKTSGSTPWSAIKNTVYLTVHDVTSSGGFEVNGVTVANNATQGVGWVPVGEAIPHSLTGQLFRTETINGVARNTYGYVQDHVIVLGVELVLPDIYPSGGLTQIKTESPA